MAHKHKDAPARKEPAGSLTPAASLPASKASHGEFWLYPFCRPFSSLFDGTLERVSAEPIDLVLALSVVKMGISSGVVWTGCLGPISSMMGRRELGCREGRS